jgi:hypothetical protein
MYAQSASRRATVAFALVAALAGILSANVAGGPPRVVTSSQIAARPATVDSMPMLPEIVVTASRPAA